MDATTRFEETDPRSRLSRVTSEARAANHAVVDLLAAMADAKGGLEAQVARAWLLAQKLWIVPIPGTTMLARLDENIWAVDLEWTADDLSEIEVATSRVSIQAARYPEAMERMTGL